jgi:outer membrane protein assembly factor BamB
LAVALCRRLTVFCDAVTTTESNGLKLVRSGKSVTWLPIAASVGAGVLLVWWLAHTAKVPLTKRIPGTDLAAGADSASSTNAVLAGKLIKGDGTASELPGTWPGFRGAARTGDAKEPTSLARTWDATGPRQLWAVELGEGYAGAAIAKGRVYLMDYDREKKQDALRCLALADGKEIWRYAYPVSVKRNHGMSRTVPAVTDKFVVAMGPKCHVICLDAITGELRWGYDLVRQFGTTIPPWYAGQCPLIENNTVVLAPAGKDVLLIGVDIESGKVLWQSPNPKGWKMTHASITPIEFGGERMYIYCGSGGVAGVSAKDGRILWDTTAWKISIATVPSPVALEGGQIFLSGGYNAGSLLLQLKSENGQFEAKTLYKLDPETFGATQQTPICYDKHLYGVRPDGQFACLDLEGKPVWSSGPSQQFGLGSFLLADGLIFVLNDSGTLSLIEATPEKFNLLARAQVLQGRESWGPMALAGTRLLARDLTRMVCLEVGRQ